MTDDRSAPPPQAYNPAPPPQAVPRPAPAAYAAPYAPPRAGGANLGWIVSAVLGAIILLLVILYFTGVLDRGARNRDPSLDHPGQIGSGTGGLGGSGTTGSGTSGLGGTGTTGTGATGTSGGALSMAAVVGTWGAGCPGTRVPSLTFTSDGRFYNTSGANGSYGVSGDRVTLTMSGVSTSSRWEPLGENSARVTDPNSAPQMLYRCP